MAAGDRTAELKLKATLEGADKAAEQTKGLRTETERLGDSAAEVAGELARESSALDDTSASIQKSTQEAQEARQAQEAMGSAGREAGGEIAAGAGKAAEATAEIGTAATEAGAKIETEADKAAHNIDVVTTKFREEAKAIRESKAPLDEQKQQLEALVSEAQKLPETLRSAPGLNDAIEASIAEVRTRLVEVDAELAKNKVGFSGLGAEAREAMESIKPRVASVDDALINAVRAIAEVEAKFAATGTTGPRDMTKISQAVEASRLALEQHAKTAIVSPEQIAAVEVLEGEVTRLNERTNRLTNAGRDNAIALQEQGQQAAGLASAAQNIVQAFDVQQITTTALLGKTVGLSLAYEQLKDHAKNLELNTFAAGKSALAYAGQIGAVTAAAYAAVRAGEALSGSSEANAESTRGFVEAAKELVSIDIATRLAAWQDASTRYAAGQITLAERGRQVEIGLRRGEAAQVAYNAAVRDGIDPQIAYALAIEKASKISEFYVESLKAGDDGNRIWREGLAQSGGEVAKLNAFLEANRERLADAGLAEQTVRAAVEAETKARKDLNRELAAINQLLPEQAKNIPALIALADALEKTAGEVKTLGAAERERIVIIADLLRRGKDLTAEQKKVVQSLLDEARAGHAADEAMNALTRARIAHNDALRNQISLQAQNALSVQQAIRDAARMEIAHHGSTVSINQLLKELTRYLSYGPAYAQNTSVLVASLQQLLATTTGLLPAQRSALEAVVQLAQRNGELTKSEREYAQSLIATILAGKGATAQAAQQLAAYAALKTATTALASVANDLATAKEKESAGIKAAVAAAEAQLLANKNLESGERVKYLQIIETGKQLIDLAESYKKAQESESARVAGTKAVVQSEAQRQEALKSELQLIRDKIALAEKELGINTAQNETRHATVASLQWLRAQEQQLLDQQQEIIIVSSGRKAAMQQEIVEKARLLESLQKETAAVNQVTTSTNQLVISGKDAQGQWERGKIAISNLSEEERKAAEQAAALARGTREVGEAADEAVEPVRKLGGVHGETQEQVLKNLEAQRTAAAETTRVFADLPTHLEKASGRMTVALGSADTALDTTAQKVRDLEALVGTLASKVDNELTAAINKMADAANRAAGEGRSSKFGDTLVAPQ